MKIPSSRWDKLLKKIFRDAFDSDLPDPEKADFYGEFENGKLKAFVLVENVKIIGQIYRMPEENDRHSVRNLVNYLVETLPKGQAVGAVASEPRFEGLFRLLKMQKIVGTFFRRNL